MKLRCVTLMASAIFAATLSAQEPPTDPRADTLVDCGTEKVAIFADSESKDGAFALGWTVRPNGKKAPVDWSAYDRNDPTAILEKFPLDGELDPARGDYSLVDGVIDLKAGKFTPLASKFPYLPHKNHGNLSVAWSEMNQGTRYAVVGNDARFHTFNLWLVEINRTSPQATELTLIAEKAVARFMQKRDPRDYQNYGFTYEIGDSAESGDAAGTLFTKDSVTMHFVAEIPKSEIDTDAGKITFALPKGTVLRIVPDKKGR